MLPFWREITAKAGLGHKSRQGRICIHRPNFSLRWSFGRDFVREGAQSMAVARIGLMTSGLDDESALIGMSLEVYRSGTTHPSLIVNVCDWLNSEIVLTPLARGPSQCEPLQFENNRAVPPTGAPKLIHDLTDRAIEWIHQSRAAAPDRPYFLNMATGATHAPHHATAEWIDRFVSRR